MKLWGRIILRMAIAMFCVFTIWAYLFYRGVINEVHDEMDDTLELMADNLIVRLLQGEALAAADNGIHCTVTLDTVTVQYADSHRHISYSNEMIYIPREKESEPSRVLRRIFRDEAGRYYRLTISLPAIEDEELSSSIALWSILLYSLLLILILILCAWIVWIGMKPLYRLLRWLREGDITQGVKPLNNPTKISEYKRLNDAAVEWARRNEQLYNQQKEFIGNASHEMQTPIAVCQNRLDLLMEMSLNEEQMNEVIKTKQTLSHLSRTGKELLLLSKIENGQYAGTSAVNIEECIARCLEEIRPIYETRGITVTCRPAPVPLVININPTLSTILINNLIKNAYLHNKAQGSILIETDARTLTLLNTGDEAPLDGQQLFRRFYQGDKRKGSTGLGLSIAYTILKQYGYRIEYNYDKELKMHRFSVFF